MAKRLTSNYGAEFIEGSDEENLVPIKKKSQSKSKTQTMLNVQDDHIAWKKRKLAVERKTSKNISNDQITVHRELAQFNPDLLAPEDCADNPRQIIIKKKNFPSECIGVIKSAVRVDFAGKNDKSNSRQEIVINFELILDLTGDDLEREVDGENISYKEIEMRFHLPKRFQDIFAHAHDLEFLKNALILAPKYDQEKWRNVQDPEKSSIPLMLFLKNSQFCEKIGYTVADYPSYEEIIKKSKSYDENSDPNEDFFQAVVSYMKTYANTFYNRESHKTNAIHKRK